MRHKCVSRSGRAAGAVLRRVGRGRLSNVLQQDAATFTNGCPSRGHALQEFRVVLEPIIEPILVGGKPDEHTCRPTVAGDHNLFVRRETQIFREVIFHFRQRHRLALVCRGPRAKPALGLWG